MNKRQLVVNASIENARIALKSEWFAIPSITRLRRELEEVEREIKTLRIDQDSVGKRQLGDRKGVAAKLRANLRRHLRPISREGRRLLKGYPGIDEDLRLPRKRESEQVLVKGAKRILKCAARHDEVFLEAKFPADFIERAQRALTALVAKEGVATGLEFEKGSRATASIKPALKRGREIIDSIDAIIHWEISDDPAAIAFWRKHKRIPKSLGGRPKKPKK